jgi:UPF0755 protein
MSGMEVKFLLGFILLAILGFGSLGAVAWKLGYFQPLGSPINFTVQKGENFAGIAHRLQANGIISSNRALRWYVNFFATRKPLQRGEFALYTRMPVPELVKVLTEGKPIEYKFTIPEGWNIFQVADELEAKGLAKKTDFLAAARSPELVQMIPGLDPLRPKPKSVEGYVYPDTYLLQKVFSAKEMAQAMVQHFRDVFKGVEKDLRDSYLAREFRFSPHQIVTLASIVEKETGASSERPLVASIFVNRLRKKMRLQTDPTIIYGIYLEKGSWDGNIRRRDLDDTGDYNSYQHDGLPPGPISNPGVSAIQAVLHPAETEYLYFVSKGDGTHVFSKDYASHAKAVQQSIRPGAKEGKSWRDLTPDQRAK